MVGAADEVGALDALNDLDVMAQHFAHQVLSEDQFLTDGGATGTFPRLRVRGANADVGDLEPTAKPTLPGSVHGVVVHARTEASSSTSGI